MYDMNCCYSRYEQFSLIKVSLSLFLFLVEKRIQSQEPTAERNNKKLQSMKKTAFVFIEMENELHFCED